jgi:hypothetical protein
MRGRWLVTSPAHPASLTRRPFSLQKALIWHHTYLHLKHTNDDTETKTLELDFGKHGGLQVRLRAH